jgi:3'-phosphoadenosine 5'-phosphosulfate sulfotransferase (PAPS reductase)/FAD synthetase
MQALLNITTTRPGRTDRGVIDDDAVAALLAANAPVAIGVSGGKDSCACALKTIEHLDAIGHTGPRVLVHSDLGRVEWADSGPTCERLAAHLGLELLTVRREAGDMMDRWLVRWSNNCERYRTLRCVKKILPWSTPAMRFCTSEMKTAVICRALVARFPGQTIVSASGIRREESARRKKAPISKPQKKLTSTTRCTTGLDWNPILEWTKTDVFAFCADRGFAMHEAYATYGVTRVSCVFCIMSSADDLVASAACLGNQDVFREMVDLEIRSTFAFQGGKWLADSAPHLLDADRRAALVVAKERAARRVAAESRIPKHLLFTKGWPTVMPTAEEAVMLCEVRSEVAALLGLTIEYTEPAALLGRYRELMAMNAAKVQVDDEDDDDA